MQVHVFMIRGIWPGASSWLEEVFTLNYLVIQVARTSRQLRESLRVVYFLLKLFNREIISICHDNLQLSRLIFQRKADWRVLGLVQL